MRNSKHLNILFIEDLPSDVDLAVLELKKEGLIFSYITVCTAIDLQKALEEFKPELIISDYMMPAFNGLQALMIVRDHSPEIPFILLTGSVNEETAVKCIKAGARDYIIKEHMTRLPFAVKEALEQVGTQMEKRASELLLKDSEEKLQSIFRVAPVGIGLVVNRVLLEVNDTLCNLIGYGRNELIGKSAEILYESREEYENVGKEKYSQIEKKGTGRVETKFRCKDGRIINVILSSTPLDTKDYSRGVTFTVLDITERNKAEQALRESEARFRALYHDAVVGLYRTNAKGEILLANNALIKMLGFGSFEELSAVNLNKTGIGTTSHRRIFIDQIEKDGEVNNLEAVWICRDGNEIIVKESAKLIKDPVGKTIFYDGTVENITQRKSMEEALRLSEEKFRSIAENIFDVIFITDETGRIQYISPACKTFGYEPEECIGKIFSDFLPADELEKAMPVFKNALTTLDDGKSASLIFKRKDGSQFFAEVTGSAFKVGNEKNGVVGIIRDVSDKMNKEIELRKLSRAVEQNPASIVITDINGNIEYINTKFCEVTGYTKEELIGKNPGILGSGETKQEDYKTLWDTINAGNDWKGEFHNKKKNGELYWESAIVSPIKNEKDEITHFLGIKEDITEKKAMEAALMANEQRYRELFLNNPVPTYIFDEDTLSFLEVNDTAAQNYGYTKQEFASMTLKDIRVPEDISDLMEAVKQLGNEVYYSLTIRHRKKDGTIFPVEITSHSLPEKNGHKTRLVIAIDITEGLHASEQLKLAKEKAEASDKLKTTFLNNISHEVRTPLNGILGFAEIVNQPDLSAEEKKDSILMLQESSDRLLGTITNYMDISLLTSGNLTVHQREFIPSQLLREVYDLYITICSGRKLKLSLDIPARRDELTVISDPEIFRKIVCHLMNNAIKFTEKGSIDYGFIIKEHEIEFFVKDTGIGIGKESFNSIFSHFVKEDRGPSKLSEGSGLGLSIAKGMIEILGGTMRVESELEQGSCFFFTIPLIWGTETDSNYPASTDRNISTGPGSILVAEDDETNFFYLKALLSRETRSPILHATTGIEAIDMFRKNPGIKLILMDIKMPEMDGLEATRQIKLLDKNIPVIAITAYAMSGDEERVLASGCDSYLSKPIRKNILLKKLAEFIKI